MPASNITFLNNIELTKKGESVQQQKLPRFLEEYGSKNYHFFHDLAALFTGRFGNVIERDSELIFLDAQASLAPTHVCL